jgi:hypothetical protein
MIGNQFVAAEIALAQFHSYGVFEPTGIDMNRIRTATFSMAALIAATGLALADQPGADWMTKEQVTQKLTAAGYTNITELEADDGHWEGKGVKNGKIMEFHVDPHSGALTKEEVDH